MKLISVFDLHRDPLFLYINSGELQNFGPYDHLQDLILWDFCEIFEKIVII